MLEVALEKKKKKKKKVLSPHQISRDPMYVYKEKYWREEVNFTGQRNHVGTMLGKIVIGWGKGAYIYIW